VVKDRSHCWLYLYSFDIIESSFGALTVSPNSQFISSTSKSSDCPKLLLFLMMSWTITKGTICITVHHKIIVCCTAASVSFVVFVNLPSLHPKIISVLFFNILPRIDLVKSEIEIYKLFETITIAVNRGISINTISFMNILIA